MQTTHALLNQLAPTRYEKKRIARIRGYKNTDSIYKECSDSGRRNPLDNLFIYIDHALAHHPDAALATAQQVMNRVVANLTSRAAQLPVAELVLSLQPGAEQEATDAVRALSTALRQMVLGGRCDTQALLREIEEADQVLTKTAVMLRAAIQAEASA